jgi:hypothetical protein
MICFFWQIFAIFLTQEKNISTHANDFCGKKN